MFLGIYNDTVIFLASGITLEFDQWKDLWAFVGLKETYLKYRIAVAPETLNCVPIFEADTVSWNAVMILATSRLVER